MRITTDEVFGILAKLDTTVEQDERLRAFVDQFETVEKLLAEAEECLWDHEASPSGDWWKRMFLHSGEHMILTEEGWEHGASTKAECVKQAEEDGAPLSEYIFDEVNAPP